jgi:hypothetical protein
MHNISIRDAKQQLRIAALWRHFGFAGEPKTSCRCPWRDDHNPSFSVSSDGLLWNDFGTGEGGDAIDFVQRATGLPKRQACQKFIELANGNFTATSHCINAQPGLQTKPRPKLPALTIGKLADLKQLAKLRNIGLEGLRFASERGVLRFAVLDGYPAWIVTDCCNVNAQARRLDGEEWNHIGAKAWTLPGSWANYPN